MDIQSPTVINDKDEKILLSSVLKTSVVVKNKRSESLKKTAEPNGRIVKIQKRDLRASNSKAKLETEPSSKRCTYERIKQSAHRKRYPI